MPPITPSQREAILPVLERLRADIRSLAGEDESALFQMRRYIAKRLEFDERGNPQMRKKLKDTKWKKQRGLCAQCNGELPIRGAELDRTLAPLGYTEENTRLVCHACHRSSQEAKNFA
jgi:uncharacterized protein with PIN domain